MFVILLFTGLLVPSTANLYHFSTAKMTWQEAQDYCSTTYNDLVEIYEPGKVEASLVEAAQSVNYRGDAWIGLKTENLDWTWVDGEPLQIDNWERADDGGEASCALMIRSGVWRGEKCWQRNNLLCEGENGTPIKAKSWAEAQAYCQTKGISLVTFSNFSKIYQVQEWMEANTVPASWIGLHKPVAWSWSSGSPVSYTNWQDGEPDLSQVNKLCGTLSTKTRKWNYDNCIQPLPFFCFGVEESENSQSQKISVRIQVKSQVNVDDQVIHASLLHQLQVAMRTQGEADFELTWTRSPEKRAGGRTEERCRWTP